MQMKKMLAVVSALCMMCVVMPFTENTVPEKTVLSANAVEDEILVYRTSTKGKCEGISESSFKWDFIFTLVAYKNGHIHIDVQCENVNSTWTCNQIGSIQFNDTMIAGIGEDGFSGTSSFDNHNKSDSKYVTSFSETDLIYTAIFSNNDRNLSGETLMSFDLFVKENYLNINQVIYLFNTKVEIPFSETQNEDFTYMQKNNITLDFNNDGVINTKDASWILVYAADLGAGNVKSLEEFCQKNEIK